eukprot:5459691-Pyramimonas_sp.AAC.1
MMTMTTMTTVMMMTMMTKALTMLITTIMLTMMTTMMMTIFASSPSSWRGAGEGVRNCGPVLSPLPTSSVQEPKLEPIAAPKSKAKAKAKGKAKAKASKKSPAVCKSASPQNVHKGDDDLKYSTKLLP